MSLLAPSVPLILDLHSRYFQVPLGQWQQLRVMSGADEGMRPSLLYPEQQSTLCFRNYL